MILLNNIIYIMTDKVKVFPIINQIETDTNLENKMCEKKKSIKKKNRCSKCNKKLGLVPFSCKCENSFCPKCRHPESHDCTFDFRAEAKAQIEKENPVIKFNKINPI
jgi:predicted nucleic acid binding AN1-type Zn finger protein